MARKPVPSNIGHLIAAQVRRWELQRPREAPRRSPCVAISRQPFALGSSIGRRVAEILDYGFFGRELVEEIARDVGVRSDLVAGLDERVESGIDRWVADTLRLRSYRESDYLRQLAHTLATFGERGRAVLVGRGAPFLLDRKQALRILFVAPRELRAKRLAERENLSDEQAAKELARRDAERHEFARLQFRVDQNDPNLYDLVVNTGSFDVEAAAHVVVEALRRRFGEAV